MNCEIFLACRWPEISSVTEISPEAIVGLYAAIFYGSAALRRKKDFRCHPSRGRNSKINSKYQSKQSIGFGFKIHYFTAGW
jgi:hypothetical protein